MSTEELVTTINGLQEGQKIFLKEDTWVTGINVYFVSYLNLYLTFSHSEVVTEETKRVSSFENIEEVRAL